MLARPVRRRICRACTVASAFLWNASDHGRSQNQASVHALLAPSHLTGCYRFSFCLASKANHSSVSEHVRSQRATSDCVLPTLIVVKRLSPLFLLSSFESQPLERFRTRQKSKSDF